MTINQELNPESMKTPHLFQFITILLFLLIGWIGCNDNSGPDLGNGSIEIITITHGENAAGYEVRIEGEEQMHVDVNDTLQSGSLNNGTYKVELLELPEECSVVGLNPVTVKIEDAHKESVTFEINCGDALNKTGTLEIISSTSLINSQEIYSVFINSEQYEIGANDTLLFENIAPDTYQIELGDLPSNCTVRGNNPQEIPVTTEFTVDLSFDVFCQTIFNYKFVYQNSKSYHFKSLRFLLADGTTEIVSPEYEYIHQITPSPDYSTIAFTASKKNEDIINLYIIDKDGTNLTQITHSPEDPEIISFSWSPDSNKISFSNSGDLYVINIDGSGLNQLTDNKTIHSGGTDWSPDGMNIVFSGYKKNDTSLADIYVIDSDGSDIINLTNSENDYYSSPLWSPDGSKIIFSSRSGNLFVFDTTTSQIINITKEQDGSNNYPDWAPDGSKIVYVKYISKTKEESMRIYTMNVDGSDVTVLTNTKPGILNQRPKWSPDGKYIIFNRFDYFDKYEPENHLFIMKVDGTQKNNMGAEGCCAKWIPLD